jgi:hypothetical protein
MTITAIDVYDRARIEDAIVLSVRFGDDVPGLYAVPRKDADECAKTARYHGATAVDPISEERALLVSGVGFIGIAIGNACGVTAWGNCRISASSAHQHNEKVTQ